MLTNMQTTQAEVNQEKREEGMDKPKYPYGLRLCLDSESLKKLNINTLPAVGEKLNLTAVVNVIGVQNYQEINGESNASVDLQIIEMDLGASEPQTSVAEKLYG